MRPIPIRRCFLTTLYCAALLSAGCARSVPVPVGQTVRPLVVSERILQSFQARGIDCRQQGDWIEFPKQSARALGTIVEKSSGDPDTHSVQLDFQMEFDSGERVTESFSGAGENREEATKDAIQNFERMCLDVILAAFFAGQDKGVRVENWTIGGEPRRVVLGPIGIGGQLPDPSNTPPNWFNQVKEKIKSANLAPNTHWIRIYYSQVDNHVSKVEVLLDNDVWEPIQEKLATVDWPKGKEFFSLQVFMVVQDK